MDFRHSNLYISLVDLFAILLPGAISSLVIYHFNRQTIDALLEVNQGSSNFLSIFILLLSSYLIGHIISQISAYMDEWVYDSFKDKVYKDKTCLGKAINNIREDLYGNDIKVNYVNTYKWSVFKLQKEYPDAAVEVERYMGDSKFFRGLFVVMLVLGIVFYFQHNVSYKVPIACFLLSVFSLIRYFTKRRKSTELAFQYIIFNEKLNNKVQNCSKAQKSNEK